jgi:hypothetical protein
MIRDARNSPIPDAFVQIRDHAGTLVKEGLPVQAANTARP